MSDLRAQTATIRLDGKAQVIVENGAARTLETAREVSEPRRRPQVVGPSFAGRSGHRHRCALDSRTLCPALPPRLNIGLWTQQVPLAPRCALTLEHPALPCPRRSDIMVCDARRLHALPPPLLPPPSPPLPSPPHRRCHCRCLTKREDEECVLSRPAIAEPPPMAASAVWCRAMAAPARRSVKAVAEMRGKMVHAARTNLAATNYTRYEHLNEYDACLCGQRLTRGFARACVSCMMSARVNH